MSYHTLETVDVAIVGAGQAGLAVSHELTARGREHLLLERASRLAEPWRSERWDSFHLNTPNWTLRLPGAPYRGDDPDGYLPRAGIVRYLEEYAASYGAPVRLGVEVQEVTPDPAGDEFRVVTNQGVIVAANVVVATSVFHRPNVPEMASRMPKSVTQMHSKEYRNPASLPPGAVLVVGSAQSGCQIAEELHEHGRTVYLSVSGAGRGPRRYRGRDVFGWMLDVGFFDRPLDPSFAPPHVSGDKGGHTINLHQFARDGIRLLGRVQDMDGDDLLLAPDLHEKLAKADAFEQQVKQMVDGFIARSGMDAPSAEAVEPLTDGFAVPQIERLNLTSAGIASVIWATGYRPDFRWIHAPVFGENGLPLQQDGRTAVPGLHFAGMSNARAHILAGAGDDAMVVAAAIAASDRRVAPASVQTPAAD